MARLLVLLLSVGMLGVVGCERGRTYKEKPSKSETPSQEAAPESTHRGADHNVGESPGEQRSQEGATATQPAEAGQETDSGRTSEEGSSKHQGEAGSEENQATGMQGETAGTQPSNAGSSER